MLSVKISPPIKEIYEGTDGSRTTWGSDKVSDIINALMRRPVLECTSELGLLRASWLRWECWGTSPPLPTAPSPCNQPLPAFSSCPQDRGAHHEPKKSSWGATGTLDTSSEAVDVHHVPVFLAGSELGGFGRCGRKILQTAGGGGSGTPPPLGPLGELPEDFLNPRPSLRKAGKPRRVARGCVPLRATQHGAGRVCW